MTWYNKILTGAVVVATGYILTELPSFFDRTLQIGVGEIELCMGKECRGENKAQFDKEQGVTIEQKIISCTPVKEEVIIEKCSPEKESQLMSLARSLDRCEKSFTVNAFMVKLEDSLVMAYAQGINGGDTKIPIKVSDYLWYKQRDHHTDVSKILGYVTYDDPYIKDIAKTLTKGSKSKEQKARAILKFVHQQLYDVSIEKTRDYFKYPLETIVERNGDCEDLAILGAALLKAIDINVVLLDYAGERGNSGHMALGIDGKFKGPYYKIEGKKYYYAEATGTMWLSRQANWKIGEIPNGFAKSAGIFVVK